MFGRERNPYEDICNDLVSIMRSVTSLHERVYGAHLHNQELDWKVSEAREALMVAYGIASSHCSMWEEDIDGEVCE